RPSINLARIVGGDRMNRVPEHWPVEVDMRSLPEQPVDRLRAELQSLPGCTVKEIGWRPPAKVSTDNEFLKLLATAANASVEHEVQCVGRDGTNDGVHFLKRGIPSVEFGPVGSGHHGPAERVSIRSLREYRLALLKFLHSVAAHADELTGLTIPARPTSDRGEPRSLL
ncbi:MAG: M20/M25/M40 family metallo-hydrolase, partial [Thermoleophilia bacterium]|nr:M20/M25/M40 family metallo-hydrolase [Thermoleophilia bacterium]